MEFRISDGWLENVRRLASPHQDARPAGVPIDVLVVHGITLPPGHFGGSFVDALFMGALDAEAHPYFAAIAPLRVSAHAFIERAGRVTQYVSFNARAWHAGASRFDGREAVNDFGIGIELEGTDDCPYAPAQYRALAGITRALMQYYPGLVREHVVGHSDIAPGRKTDPGPAFDWTRFDRELERSCT